MECHIEDILVTNKIYGQNNVMYPINYVEGLSAMMMGGTSINQSVQGVQTSHFSGNRSTYTQGRDGTFDNDDFFKGSRSL